jgi:hypothetical protein
VRDLIAPRFFRVTMTDARKAILAGTPAQREDVIETLRLITRNLSGSRSLLMKWFLLPALRRPALGRMIMKYRVPLARVARLLK